MNCPNGFDPDSLRIYSLALGFAEDVDRTAERYPVTHRYLSDQFRRAATSVALNLAEGAGEFAPREKARFYRMAKRSATECAAVIDLSERVGLIGREERKRLRAPLWILLGSLTRLAIACERRGQHTKGAGRFRPGSP